MGTQAPLNFESKGFFFFFSFEVKDKKEVTTHNYKSFEHCDLH